MNLDVRDASAFDGLLYFLGNPLDEDNALVGKARDPLDHLLRDLVVLDLDQGLDRVGPLAKVQEDHFAAGSAGCLDSCTEENGLPNKIWEINNSLAGKTRSRLRLVQWQRAIVGLGEVLDTNQPLECEKDATNRCFVLSLTLKFGFTLFRSPFGGFTILFFLLCSLLELALRWASGLPEGGLASPTIVTKLTGYQT